MTEHEHPTTLVEPHETEPVEDFVHAHRSELLEHVKRRIAETRKRIRKTIQAADRLDPFAG